jgi:pre-rRNA-processing protein IPI1
MCVNPCASHRAVVCFLQKLRAKVGKKAPNASNATKIDFTVRGINVPSQDNLGEKNTEFVTRRKQDLETLLTQCNHYNVNTRRDAYLGLKELLTTHPTLVQLHFSRALQTVATGMVDEDKRIRQGVKGLLGTVFGATEPEEGLPMLRLLVGYVSSAMSHIYPPVRRDSVDLLHTVVNHFRELVWHPRFLPQLLANLLQLFKDR